MNKPKNDKAENKKSQLETIIVRYKNNEKNALKELYSQLLELGMQQYNFKWKESRISQVDAEDIVAEKSSELILNNKLKSQVGINSYVYISFKHAFTDFCRKNKSKTMVPLEEKNEENEYYYLYEPSVYTNDGELKLEYEDLKRAINEGIQAQPPKTKAVLNLALIKGLDSDEIMEELKLSRSNINHANFRGINKLKQQIGYKGYSRYD